MAKPSGLFAKVTVAERVKKLRLHRFPGVSEAKMRESLSHLIACGYFRQISDDVFEPMIMDDNDAYGLRDPTDAFLAGYLWYRAKELSKMQGSC